MNGKMACGGNESLTEIAETIAKLMNLNLRKQGEFFACNPLLCPGSRPQHKNKGCCSGNIKG